jgi:PPOX class probable F420-dependent enzyme
MGALSAGAARERFAAERVVRLATADAEGRPHLVPAVFALDGDRLYIAIDHKPKRTRDLRRLRNIAVNPRVALLADHYDDDWTRLWWARADGVAEVGPAVDGPLDLLAARYPPYRQNRPDGPLITVTVQRWTGWSYG